MLLPLVLDPYSPKHHVLEMILPTLFLHFNETPAMLPSFASCLSVFSGTLVSTEFPAPRRTPPMHIELEALHLAICQAIQPAHPSLDIISAKLSNSRPRIPDHVVAAVRKEETDHNRGLLSSVEPRCSPQW